MNFDKIANKIEDMIKESLQNHHLVKTGKLLHSIKVTVDNKGTYSINAEDYFTFLDEKYNILKDIFASSELEKYIELIMTDEFNNELNT
jgi:hypothetical protein